jgi:hypothetical protein
MNRILAMQAGSSEKRSEEPPFNDQQGTSRAVMGGKRKRLTYETVGHTYGDR